MLEDVLIESFLMAYENDVSHTNALKFTKQSYERPLLIIYLRPMSSPLVSELSRDGKTALGLSYQIESLKKGSLSP